MSRRTVALGELLQERRDRVTVAPGVNYDMAGVYGFGRGLLLRGAIRGDELSADHLYRISAGQIIYSRLKAFEGAFALVPESGDGRYVSNEFPTFDVSTDEAVPEYIALVLSLPRTWSEMSQYITGVGARRERLQVRDFLSYEVQLPTLDTQRRIVEAVGAADAVVVGAQREARAAEKVAEALYDEIVAGGDVERVRLADVMQLDLYRCSVDPTARYAIAGVRIAGEGLFMRETIDGSTTKYAKLHRLRAGHVVYRKLTAWEGPITVVTPEFDGAFVSPEFPTFTLERAKLDADFMRFVCRQPWFHREMKALSTGTAERRNRLKPADFLQIEIELPSISRQQAIAVAMQTVAALEREADAAARLRNAVRDQMMNNTDDLLGAAA